MLQQIFRMKNTGESSAFGGSIPPQYITVEIVYIILIYYINTDMETNSKLLHQSQSLKT